MKKIILFLVFLLTAVFAEAEKSVGYWYKIFATEGCGATYSVVCQDSNYYIVVTISSDRLVFTENPTMMIRTFDDEVLTFEGFCINNTTSAGGVVVGSVLVPITDIHTVAQFAITPEQFEILRHGVAKIRLTMTPVNHDKIFKKDVLGKGLYKLYLQEKANAENF